MALPEGARAAALGPEPLFRSSLSRFPAIAAWIALATGAVVLAAWFTGIEPVQELLPNHPKMVANSAVGLLLAGGALGVLARPSCPHWARTTGVGLAVVLLALGLATLAEYLTGWDLRIDRVLPHDPSGTGGSTIVGRPSQHTALSLTLLGGALLFGSAGRARPARALAWGVATVAGTVLVGHLYESQALYAVEGYLPYTGMAVHTALALGVLAVGVATLQPGPILLTATEPTAHGLLLRWLLPAAMVAPIAIGSAVLRALRAGAGVVESVTVGAAATAAIGAGLVALTAAAASRADARRRESERELVERERAFADAYERERLAAEHLRDLADLKTRFVQGVSHELRTPLAAIQGFTSLIVETAEGEELDPAAISLWARRIDANARRLEAQVEDLLDLDRHARGVLTARRRPVDTGSIVAAVLERLGVADHPITVAIDIGPVLVDPAQLERIVEHLVANAAEHTPRGTPIWISAEPDAESLLLTVADAGPGVADADKEAIFEPFHARGPRAMARGAGVGLTLVARYADIHGGTVWVEDRPGGGAAFKVRLPAWPEPRRPRVLVVGAPAPHEEVARLCASSAHAAGAAWSEEDGADVAYCAGVLDRGPGCPLVSGGPCALVDSADTIVMTLPPGEWREQLVSLIRERRPEAAVLVIDQQPAAAVPPSRWAR